MTGKYAVPGWWAEDANCTGHTDLFAIPVGYDERTRGRKPTSRRIALNTRIAHAKTLCAACSVRTECAEWALTTPDPASFMIAGGMTPRERGRRRRNLHGDAA